MTKYINDNNRRMNLLRHKSVSPTPVSKQNAAEKDKEDFTATIDYANL